MARLTPENAGPPAVVRPQPAAAGAPGRGRQRGRQLTQSRGGEGRREEKEGVGEKKS